MQDDHCGKMDDSGCRLSEDCKKLGRCSVVGATCNVKTDADCAGSDVCKLHGWCKAVLPKGSFGTTKQCFSTTDVDFSTD